MAKNERLTAKSKEAIKALNKFPNLSKTAVARYLVDKFPLLYRDVESARGIIKTACRREYIPKDEQDKRVKVDPNNPYNLPISEGKKREFVSLPKVCNNVLWLSDIHFPNQDNEALTIALNYGKEHGINCIVLGGDILDNTPFTNHLAPPVNKADARIWFDMVSNFLDTLKKEFNCPIYWIEGNHDNWYERYLMKYAPVIWDDEYFRIEQRLGLKQRGVTFLRQNVILKAGKLNLLHGHTVVRGAIAPVNPARGVFLRMKSSTMIGHVHQNSYHPEKTLNGDIIGCWSVGCLCTLAPLYSPHETKHGHGFAHIQVKPNGNFTVTLKDIHNGVLL